MAVIEQQEEMREQMTKIEQCFIQELNETETRLNNELVTVQKENSYSQDFIGERLEERGRILMKTLRMLQENVQCEFAAAAQEQKKRQWWSWGK